MATSIAMPQLGESVTEGTVGRWLKSVGDRIERDEPLVEIVTDKVNVEVPSPEAGYLVRIIVEEGATVAVGTEIAVLDSTPGGSGTGSPEVAAQVTAVPAPAEAAPAPAAAPAPVGAATAKLSRAPAAPVAAPVTVAAAPTDDADSDDQPRTSPLVRRLAKEHGIALADIQGSGLGGRVTRDDVLAFIESKGLKPGAGATEAAPAVEAAAPAAAIASSASAKAASPASAKASTRPAEAPVAAPAAGAGAASAPTASAAAASASAAPVAPSPASTKAAGGPSISAGAPGGGTWQQLSPMRRAIADHMVRSVSTAPHVTMCVEIDMTGVAKRRESAQAEFRAREGFELTYLPFVAKALCEALREHPHLNARHQTNESGQQGILLLSQLNLGIAVGLDAGLVVPVIRQADGLSIAGLARAVRDLATKARASKLGVDDMRGGTFTLNNTGAFGSISSNPIINDGQAGIMTTEAIARRPVVVTRDGEEAIVIRSMMTSCLTFDHRVLDGLQAGRFMQAVKRRLEVMNAETPLY